MGFINELTGAKENNVLCSASSAAEAAYREKQTTILDQLHIQNVLQNGDGSSNG